MVAVGLGFVNLAWNQGVKEGSAINASMLNGYLWDKLLILCRVRLPVLRLA
jgi:hypothetical protein